jgi:NitT/TauT family transport system permease protein
VTDAFRPNGVVSSRSAAVIAACTAALMAAVWLSASSPVVPTPGEVARALLALAGQGLFAELYSSLVANFQAVAISTAISLALSYLTVVPAVRPFVALISKARFFGMTGFVVVFTVMFGAGHALKVSLLVFGMTVFFVTSMSDVVASIPREEFDHARTLRMGGWRTVWEVVVLGRADSAIEALRQNAAIGWMMLTMVEGLTRAEGGVGAMMLNENKHFNMAAVFAIQLVVLSVGVGQDMFIGLVRSLLCPYATMTLERK